MSRSSFRQLVASTRCRLSLHRILVVYAPLSFTTLDFQSNHFGVQKPNRRSWQRLHIQPTIEHYIIVSTTKVRGHHKLYSRDPIYEDCFALWFRSHRSSAIQVDYCYVIATYQVQCYKIDVFLVTPYFVNKSTSWLYWYANWCSHWSSELCSYFHIDVISLPRVWSVCITDVLRSHQAWYTSNHTLLRFGENSRWFVWWCGHGSTGVYSVKSVDGIVPTEIYVSSYCQTRYSLLFSISLQLSIVM